MSTQIKHIKSLLPAMIPIPTGSFQMGSEEDLIFYGETTPIRGVHIQAFEMAEVPVTQALWKVIMNENPSHFQGLQRPIENVSWEDVQMFLTKLNRELDANFRLPSEAEWEYAARGGAYQQGWKYAGSDYLEEVGWFRENSYGETKSVSLKLPNAIGLYDMSGNVWEWCEDRWHNHMKLLLWMVVHG